MRDLRIEDLATPNRCEELRECDYYEEVAATFAEMHDGYDLDELFTLDGSTVDIMALWNIPPSVRYTPSMG